MVEIVVGWEEGGRQNNYIPPTPPYVKLQLVKKKLRFYVSELAIDNPRFSLIIDIAEFRKRVISCI